MAGAPAVLPSEPVNQCDFTTRYPEIHRSVEAATRRLIPDRSVAQEVAQDVMVELWRTWARYDPSLGSDPRAWAVTIARRRAIDRLRADRARRDREVRYARAETRPGADPVSEEAIGRVEAAEVHRVLGTLGRAKRESVTLAYLGGNSYRSVASQLSLPEGTVKRRIRDGLRHLAAHLGPAA